MKYSKTKNRKNIYWSNRSTSPEQFVASWTSEKSSIKEGG